jgi:hypothetical protein
MVGMGWCAIEVDEEEEGGMTVLEVITVGAAVVGVGAAVVGVVAAGAAAEAAGAAGAARTAAGAAGAAAEAAGAAGDDIFFSEYMQHEQRNKNKRERLGRHDAKV